MTALAAALINGAVGYGFSSVLTPIAIFWYSNKILNPALVIVEVVTRWALPIRELKHIRAERENARDPVITTPASQGSSSGPWASQSLRLTM